MPLELASTYDHDDVFTVQIPKVEALDEIHFVLDNMETLITFVEVYTGLCPCGPPPPASALREPAAAGSETKGQGCS